MTSMSHEVTWEAIVQAHCYFYHIHAMRLCDIMSWIMEVKGCMLSVTIFYGEFVVFEFIKHHQTRQMFFCSSSVHLSVSLCPVQPRINLCYILWDAFLVFHTYSLNLFLFVFFFSSSRDLCLKISENQRFIEYSDQHQSHIKLVAWFCMALIHMGLWIHICVFIS